METPLATLDYLEFPTDALGSAVGFYGQAFGWRFTRYGDQYAACEDGPCQLGLDAGEGRVAMILPVIRVASLEEARASVIAAGGTITREPFAYPGGERFHFADPEGRELACYVPDA